MGCVKAMPTQAQIRNSTINEMDFSLDAFNNQKVYVGAMAYAYKIRNLLFMRPGDMPSIPEAGLNIQSIRFQDIDVLAAGDLREKLSTQITAYVFDITTDDISISVNKYNNQYYLIITISLTQLNTEIMYAVENKRRDVINFNFKVYQTENVEIW